MSAQSQNVNKGGSNAAGAMSKASRPQGAAPARRAAKPSQAGAMLGQQGGGSGILRFYTDDAPGLKIGPVSRPTMTSPVSRAEPRHRHRTVARESLSISVLAGVDQPRASTLAITRRAGAWGFRLAPRPLAVASCLATRDDCDVALQRYVCMWILTCRSPCPR